MDETEKRLDSLCSRILESDKAIRFVGISNKMGSFAFIFDFDLAAFLVVGSTSRLVVLIGPGGVVEGSVDSVDILF